MPVRSTVSFALVAVLALLWLGVRRASHASEAPHTGVTSQEDATRGKAAAHSAPDGVPELVLIARDSRGRRIPEIVVTLTPGAMFAGDGSPVVLRLRDVDGHYEVDGLAAGEWTVAVEAQPWQVQRPSARTPVVLPLTAPVEVYAVGPGELEAIVTDALGRPQPGVEVRFEGANGAVVHHVSDGAGRARSGPLTAGAVRVDARHGRATANSRTHVAVDELGLVDLQLTGGRLTGLVVDSFDVPRPWQWVHVTDVASPPRPLAEVRTDETGCFTVPVLEPGDVQVWTGLESRGAAGPSNARSGAHPPAAVVTILDGEETQLRLVVGPTPSTAQLRGQLLLDDRTMPDVEITFVREQVRSIRQGGRGTPLGGAIANGGTETQVARTDRAGAYSAELDEEGRWALLLAIPGRPTFPIGRIEVESGATERDVRLPTSELEGRVVDAEGRGLAGAWVEAAPATPWCHGPLHDTARPAEGAAQPRSPARLSGAATRSAADGSFRLTGLLPGPWVVSAKPKADNGLQPWAQVSSQVLDVRAGDRSSAVLLECPRAGSISLRFERPAVDTGDDVIVELRNTAGLFVGARPTVLRRAAGEDWRIDGLAPGSYRVMVRKGLRVTQWSKPVTVEAGRAAELTVELIAGADLEVEVRGQDGTHRPSSFTLLDVDGFDITRAANPRSVATGRCSLGPLASGRYTVVARCVDGAGARRDVLIEAGRPFTLALEASL